MADEWDFQRIRRLMEEQAAMPPPNNVITVNMIDDLQQRVVDSGTCSMPAEVAAAMATNTFEAVPAAALDMSVQQLYPITSDMEEAHTSDMPKVAAESNSMFQQTPSVEDQAVAIPVKRFNAEPAENLIQRTLVSSVEEETHDLLHGDIAPIPNALASFKKSGEKFHAASMEVELGVPWRRVKVYKKFKLPTKEEPSLELRLGNDLHKIDAAQGRQLMQQQSRGKGHRHPRGAAAYRRSQSPGFTVPRIQTDFGYIDSRPSAFSIPPAPTWNTMPPPLVSRVQLEDLQLPEHQAQQLQALKNDARAAAAIRSHRQPLTGSSADMPIVLPTPYENNNCSPDHNDPQQNCNRATSKGKATLQKNCYPGTKGKAAMGAMGPPVEVVISARTPLRRQLPLFLPDVSFSAIPPRGGAALAAGAGVGVHDHPLLDPDALNLNQQLQQIIDQREAALIPSSRKNAVVAVTNNVPDFWVTLTTFAVDWRAQNQPYEVQLILPPEISQHLPNATAILTLQIKSGADGPHKNSSPPAASSSSRSSDAAAATAATHHHGGGQQLEWRVTWRPTPWISSLCDGWVQFVKDGKLAVGDFCWFHQSAWHKNVFEVEIIRPIKLI